MPILDPVEVWRRYDAVEARLTAAISERMLDLAGVGEGARLLDLATGRGEPAIRAASRVGPRGRVLGVEPDAAVLAMAREQAAAFPWLELRAMEAEAVDAIAAFDACTCRWGLMYMRDPRAALGAARRACVPGAPVVLALWAEPERVPYSTLPRSLLERPPPPVDPEAAGTFRYASPGVIARDLEAAGLRIEAIEEHAIDVIEVETPEALVAWCSALGLARLLAAEPPSVRARWEARMLDAARSLRGGDGRFRLGGVTRLVVARG